jgi:signal transduction histidine kinase
MDDRSQTRSLGRCYLVAVGATGVVAAYRLLLLSLGWQRFDAPFVFSPFILSVIAAAWYGGLGPGLVATALGVFAGSWFLPPNGAIWITRTEDWDRLAMFVLIGIWTSVLCENLHSTRRRVEIYARKLAATRRRLEEFLAVAAHELRNPLSPIHNSLFILSSGTAGEAARQHAYGVMDRQLNQLNRLIDDLLDLGRVIQGKIRLYTIKVNLAGVIQTAVEASRPLLDERRHELTVTLPPTPVLVNVDPDRLTQVVSNLLNNAARYTDPGGRIWLTMSRDADEVVLSVRDNGTGISPDVLPNLFDLFAQADHPRERSSDGLGVGLWLVKRLVEMHDGRVEARSDGPGKGSEFIVVLPELTDREWSSTEGYQDLLHAD